MVVGSGYECQTAHEHTVCLRSRRHDRPRLFALCLPPFATAVLESGRARIQGLKCESDFERAAGAAYE
jgi:hypothetical protein